MGIFSSKKKITENSILHLTAVGRQKADSCADDGVRGLILSSLSESGGVASVREIANESHMSPEKVVRVVNLMINEGYIRESKQGEN